MAITEGTYESVIANRRVSFAPEATLHTWDVIEYLRDGNTTTTSSSSSSSSNNTVDSVNPRASPRTRRQSSDGAISPEGSRQGRPSTPPEQDEVTTEIEGSDASQRQKHQQKRRRRRESNGVPPLDFNDTVENDYSSSPLTGSSSPAAPSPELRA